MRIITIKIPERMLEELDMYALRHDLSRSEAIREAIRQHIILGAYPKIKVNVKRVVLS